MYARADVEPDDRSINSCLSGVSICAFICWCSLLDDVEMAYMLWNECDALEAKGIL